MKKSSIFKLEKILFFLSGQVVQLSRYTFFGLVDPNGLGVGWGRGENPWGQIFCQKLRQAHIVANFLKRLDMKFPKNRFFLVNWQKIFESQVELGRVGQWGCKKNDQKCKAHSIPNCLKRLNNIVSKQLFFYRNLTFFFLSLEFLAGVLKPETL